MNSDIASMPNNKFIELYTLYTVQFFDEYLFEDSNDKINLRNINKFRNNFFKNEFGLDYRTLTFSEGMNTYHFNIIDSKKFNYIKIKYAI